MQNRKLKNSRKKKSQPRMAIPEQLKFPLHLEPKWPVVHRSHRMGLEPLLQGRCYTWFPAKARKVTDRRVSRYKNRPVSFLQDPSWDPRRSKRPMRRKLQPVGLVNLRHLQIKVWKAEKARDQL